MESMNGTETADRWAVFERSRQRLLKVAIRIVGAADDAEDLVQETSLRWLQTDTAAVRAPEGWLVTVITRLSVDHLRRATKERQAYSEAGHLDLLGTSLTTPDRPTELASHSSMAFHVLRERLEPAERIAFVLREAFTCGYDEIARVLAKTEGACRQIVHRARERVRQRRSRCVPRREGIPGLAERFLGALSTGDREGALAALTAEPGRAPVPRLVGRPRGSCSWRRSPAPASRQRSWSPAA